MKFKIQKCQTDAVEASADVFAGKPNRTARYTRDLGRHRDMQKHNCVYVLDALDVIPAEAGEEDRVKSVQVCSPLVNFDKIW